VVGSEVRLIGGRKNIKKTLKIGKCIFDLGCTCSFYSKNIFENVKKIRTKILFLHLDGLCTHDQVSW
jgi:hypothetical protein